MSVTDTIIDLVQEVKRSLGFETSAEKIRAKYKVPLHVRLHGAPEQWVDAKGQRWQIAYRTVGVKKFTNPGLLPPEEMNQGYEALLKALEIIDAWATKAGFNISEPRELSEFTNSGYPQNYAWMFAAEKPGNDIKLDDLLWLAQSYINHFTKEPSTKETATALHTFFKKVREWLRNPQGSFPLV